MKNFRKVSQEVSNIKLSFRREYTYFGVYFFATLPVSNSFRFRVDFIVQFSIDSEKFE